MITTEQVRRVPNPEGIGGFAHHPENRNNGGRYPRGESLTSWINIFLAMTVKEFVRWEANTPDNQKTMAASLAYQRVLRAKEELREYQVVADRVEGKAQQTIIAEKGFFNETELKIITHDEERS